MKSRHLFLFLMAALAYAFGLVPTVDPDMGWHLGTGAWILKHGIPITDPFSFTARGHFWTAHECLSEVIMRLLYGVGGYPALMIFFALLGVVVFGFIYASCPRRPYLAAMLAFIAILASRFLWGARPQIFNILMMSAFLFLIQGVRMRRLHWKFLYARPLLIMLWVNLHSGYLLGIVVMVAFLTGDLFQAYVLRSEEGTLGEKGLAHLSGVILLCVAAACVNPAGYKILLYPFGTLSSRMMQLVILEWQTPTFHHWNYWPFLAIMSLGSALFLLFPPKRNISDFLIYAGSMAMGLSARRHIPFFAIAAIPIIAQTVCDGFPVPAWGERWRDSVLKGPRRTARYVLNALLAVWIMTGIFSWTEFRLKQNPVAMEGSFPVKAVRFMKDHGGISSLKIYNEYVWGGYLIWKDMPIFIDGRADLYGDQFFSDYLSAHDMRGGVIPITRYLNSYAVDGILVPPGGPLGSAFLTNPEWQLVYRDSTAVLFLRKTALPGRSLTREEKPVRFYAPLIGKNA